MSGEFWRPGEVVLGLYEVRDVVHSGGMGVVHRVRHREWDIDLAVKTPRPEYVRSEEDRRQFEAEAGTWVRLGLHPHTVNCAYVRSIDGLPRVFAEWVDGGSLAEAVAGGRLYQGGPRAALARVLDVAVQTAWGLEHAHAGGLVHQDVKPANIMLEPDGTAKVTDFGLAGARPPGAAAGPGAPLSVTFAGMTLPYCSPEQALAATGRADIRQTPATDVWSWALTVLEMFTGRVPADYGPAAPEALEALLAGGPAHAPVPAAPPAVVGLLRQCFMPDPEARPDLADLGAALRGLYAELTGTPFPRPAPEAAALLADGLCNQALSLLDLGRTEEAEARWREAMTAEPHHLAATYNFGLHRWRTARKTDVDLLAEVESAREIGGDLDLGARLLGFVHLERDDRERAAELLHTAGLPGTAGGDAPARGEGEGAPAGTAVAVAGTADALAELARDPGPRPVVLAGHDTGVSAVAVTADGSVVLSGDLGGRLRLWETGSGRCLRELTSGGPGVVAAAVDAAGRTALVGRAQGPPEAWDLARGQRLPLVAVAAPGAGSGSGSGSGAGEVTAVALSGDGSTGATGHSDGTLWFWRMDTGAPVGGARSGVERMTVLELSDDGAVAVSAGDMRDAGIRLWDVAAARCGAVLTEPRTDPLRSAWGAVVRRAAAAPGARYALQVWGGPMVLWDVWTGRIAAQVPHDLVDVSALALTADGSLAVVGGAHPLRVVQTETGRCLRTVDDGDAQHVFSVAVSADGRWAVLPLPGGGRIRVQPLPVPGYRAPWAYARPRPAGELTGHAERFRAAMREGVRRYEEGRYAQAAAALRSARAVPDHARHPELLDAWNALGRHGRRTGLRGAWQTFDFTGPVASPTAVAFAGDTSRFAIPLRWERTVLCDAADARRHQVLYSSVTATDSLTLTGAARAVLHGTGEVGLADLLEDRSVTLPHDDVTATATAAGGGWLLSGDDRGTLCRWDVEDVWRQLDRAGPESPHEPGPSSSFRGHPRPVGALAIGPDGRFGASNAFAGDDPGTQLHFGQDELCGWDLATGARLWRHAGRPGRAGLRLSPDGGTLLEYGHFGLTSFDARTGRPNYAVEGLRSVKTLATSADGRRVVVAGYATLVVLDLATGRVLRDIDEPGFVNAVALTADGRFALTGLTNEEVHVWDLDEGRRLRVLAGHRGQVFGLALSADARRLVAVGLDAIRCWELDWDYTW